MEHRTKRDLTFLNLVSDFETNFEKGHSIFFDEKTFHSLIRFYEEELQYSKAIEVADLALQQYNFRTDFYIIKARLLFQSNFHQEALVLLEKAESISPFEHEVLFLKIRILAFQGRIDEAQNILEEMKQYITSADLSDVYLSESYINEVLQNYDGMYDSLTKAIICDPENDDALDRIGFAVQIAKNYEQSIEFHKAIIDEHPFNYLSWYNLGHAQASLGSYIEAIDSIEYSFLIEENFENGYLDCADICIQTQNYKRALSTYESYVGNFGYNEEVLINMADCEYELDNPSRAKILLNKVLKLDPYNDEVYYKIGLCFAKEEKWNKAINAFHKAIALEDSLEDYYLATAKAYNALGSYDNAATFFEKAVQNGTEQSFYWKEYAAFLLKIGKKSEAIQILEEADKYTVGPDLIFCKAVAMYMEGDRSGAFLIIEEGLKEDFEQHYILFDIEPELALDKDLQSMISYYKLEIENE